MSRRLSIMAVAIAAAAGAAAGLSDAAVAAGPSPGVTNAIAAENGEIRYVATAGVGETTLAVVRTRDGRVLRYASLSGSYGIPLVTYTGTSGGLSRDGRSLVLATPGGAAPTTAFVLVDTRKLHIKQRVVLKGTWSFDALSPDARTLYLIQYLQPQNAIRYRVRAYDLAAHRPIAGAIVDPEEKGPMAGLPIARTTTRDGVWAYTLYQGVGASKPFIHALDTVHRRAVCIDLEWHGTQAELAKLRLRLSADGRHLLLSSRGRTVITVAAPR
jgi:hypothetical protein